jgi:hypothetical protein
MQTSIDTDVSLQAMLACEGEEPLAVLLQFLKHTLNWSLRGKCWAFTPSSEIYTPSTCYKFMFKNVNASPLFKKLWESKILHKQKVFVWLFLVD